jgi:hypothetical protein
MNTTYTAEEIEATVWGRLDEESVREPSDEQVGQIIQQMIAPDMFDKVEFGMNAQAIIWEAMARALARELETPIGK